VEREQEGPTQLAPLRLLQWEAHSRYQNPLNRKLTYYTTYYHYRLPNTPPFRPLSATKTLDGLLRGHVL
jgi:hypothetical protein